MAFPDPIVAGNKLVVPAIESVDYVPEGTTGWQIARDGTASFTNLNLLGDIGAGNVNADIGNFNDIALPNYPSLADELDSFTQDLSGRVVGYFQQTDAGISGVVGTFVDVIDLDCFMQPGRIYTIHGMLRVQPSAIDTNNQWQVIIRGTAGAGVAPPGNSGGGVLAQHVGSFYQTAHLETAPFDSSTIPIDTPLRLSLNVQRLAGVPTLSTGPVAGGGQLTVTGTAIIYTMRYTGAFLYVLDHGPSYNMPFFQGYNSTDTPPAATPPPPTPKTYTKTYYATWSRTFDGDNTTTWDDSAYGYHGYYSGTRGNTKSLFGFDYATIMSDLSGATINSCYLTIKGAHAYYNAGFTCYWGTHNLTAKPSTWNGANVNERRGSTAGLAAGETVKLSLGTSVGGEFKSGTSKGIAIGPPASTSLTYYGYIYGATQSGKPYLTITYTK
jgi:hypothetical protein